MPAHRIVAIDFDSQIGQRLHAAFAPPEFEFRWFGGGIEALAALQDLQPDVIICDVMLPDIDGRAVLDAVRRSPTLREVPFLVLSGTRSEATIRATLDAGADAFLLKPFPISQLVQTVRRVLKDTQAGAAEPVGEPHRAFSAGHGLSAVARAGREGAPTAARALAGEATGRQRIGFETRDPVVETPRLEAPLVPPAGERLRGREDAGVPARERDGELSAPIRLEGRISSLELDGAHIRIVTEAEKGRTLVVRTTMARDGKELRRVETTMDQPLESGDLERSLKELIELQHTGALREVSRLPTPAPARRQARPLATEPEERRAEESGTEAVPAPEPSNPEPDPVTLASGEAVVFGPKPARPEIRATSQGRTRKPARKRTSRPAPAPVEDRPAPAPVEDRPAPAPVEDRPAPVSAEDRPAPFSVATVVLERAVEMAPAPVEQDSLTDTQPYTPVLALEPIGSRSKRVWLAVVPVLLLIATGLLLKGPFGAATTPRTRTPSVSASAPVPEAEPSAAKAEPSASIAPAPRAAQPPQSPGERTQTARTPRAAQPPQSPGERTQTARTPRPSKASLERLVRGRREWAQALYEAGRLEEARAALGEVFKLAPTDAEARKLAAQLQRTPRGLASPAASSTERGRIDPGVAGEVGAAAVEPRQSEAARNAQAVPSEIPASAAEGERRPPAGRQDGEAPPTSGLEVPNAPSRPQVRLGTLMKLDTPGLVAPIAEHKPPLAYPPMALRHKVEGTVELRALVDEIGAVADVRIMRGLATREDLNEAAVQYVKKWTFRPATSDSVPVKVWLPVKVEFRLPK